MVYRADDQEWNNSIVLSASVNNFRSKCEYVNAENFMATSNMNGGVGIFELLREGIMELINDCLSFADQ